jgi:hypothetical protein
MIPLLTVVCRYTFKAVISRNLIFKNNRYNYCLQTLVRCPINRKQERQAISSLVSLVPKEIIV